MLGLGQVSELQEGARKPVKGELGMRDQQRFRVFAVDVDGCGRLKNHKLLGLLFKDVGVAQDLVKREPPRRVFGYCHVLIHILLLLKFK